MGVSYGQIQGGYWVLEKLFPARPLEELTSESLESLKHRYRRRDSMGNIIGPLVFLAMAVAYYGLIVALMSAVRGRLPAGTRHVIGTDTTDYVVCAGFLSLVSSFYVVFLFLRWILGKEEYALYMAYGAGRLPRRIDIGKVSRAFFWLVFPALAVWMALYLTTYTAFTDRAIVESPFGAFGNPRRAHRYADIKGVYLVRKYHGRFRDFAGPSFVIVFKDGSRWSSGVLTPRVFDVERPVIQYALGQSGAPTGEVNFPEDVPG